MRPSEGWIWYWRKVMWLKLRSHIVVYQCRIVTFIPLLCVCVQLKWERNWKKWKLVKEAVCLFNQENITQTSSKLILLSYSVLSFFNICLSISFSLPLFFSYSLLLSPSLFLPDTFYFCFLGGWRGWGVNVHVLLQPKAISRYSIG